MTEQLAIYEQPLTERIRTLLRLEFLFGEAATAIEGDSPWHSRRAIDSLIEILGVLGRGDLRSEAIQELERLTGNLQRLEGAPGVAPGPLQETLRESRRLIAELKEVRGHPGRDLKADELLGSIMQRTGIAGGTCGFDLPAYQHWLLRPAEERKAQLRTWFSSFDYLRDAGTLLLSVLRSGCELEPQQARGGMYQRNLERGTAYQMIRIALPADSPYFPEISGSKLFFTVRFLTHEATRERPAPAEHDVDFHVSCCVV